MVKFLDDKALVDVNRALERIEVGGMVYSGAVSLYALSAHKKQKAIQSKLIQNFVDMEESGAGLRQSSAPATLGSPSFASFSASTFSSSMTVATSEMAAASARAQATDKYPPPPPKRASSAEPSPAKRKRADSEASVRSISTNYGLPVDRIFAIKRHVTFILVLNEITSNEDFDFSDTPMSSFEPRTAVQAFAECKAFFERVLLLEDKGNLIDVLFNTLRHTMNVWNGKQTTCCRYLPEGDENPMAPDNADSLIFFFYNASDQYRRVSLVHLTCRSADDDAFAFEGDSSQRSYLDRQAVSPYRLLSPTGFSGTRSVTPASGMTSPDDGDYERDGSEDSDEQQ